MKEYAIGITTEGEIQVVNKFTHFEDYIEMLLKMTVTENLLDFGIRMKIKQVKGDFADLIKWLLCKSRTRLFADPDLISYNKTLEGLASRNQMETAKLKDLVKYLAKIMKAVQLNRRLRRDAGFLNLKLYRGDDDSDGWGGGGGGPSDDFGPDDDPFFHFKPDLKS